MQMTANSNFVIRSATSDDMDFLIPLIGESSGGVWPTIWKSIKTESETVFEFASNYMIDSNNKLSIENTYIGELEGQLLAAIIIYNERNDTSNAEVKTEKHAMPPELIEALSPYAELSDLDSLFISELCTVPEARGKGIGSLMLGYSKIMAKSLGYRSLTLRVFSQNVLAIRLYTRFGFSIVDQRSVLPYAGFEATGDVLLMRYCVEEA